MGSKQKQRAGEEMSWIGRKLFLYNVTIGLYAMDWWERYLFSILHFVSTKCLISSLDISLCNCSFIVFSGDRASTFVPILFMFCVLDNNFWGFSLLYSHESALRFLGAPGYKFSFNFWQISGEQIRTQGDQLCMS